jgi:hypothetical protein
MYDKHGLNSKTLLDLQASARRARRLAACQTAPDIATMLQRYADEVEKRIVEIETRSTPSYARIPVKLHFT